MNNETAQTWPHSSVFQDDMAQENMVLIPILTMLLIGVLLLVIVESPVLLPFFYAIF